MHGGLLCQTDETPDARELYAAQVTACDDCVTDGEVTSLAQAALAAEAGSDARRRPPLASSPGFARKAQG